jgi:hypothetical protein
LQAYSRVNRQPENKTLALGLTEQYLEDGNLPWILTPLKSVQTVMSVQVGSVRLTSSFEDEGF